MEKERDFEIMRTYARAWQSEIVMYHLFGVPLWFPISARQAVFFIIGLSFTFAISNILPGIKKIVFIGDPILLYIVYPYLIMNFFTKLTLDGKPPHVYFKDQLRYLMENKKYDMYRPVNSENNIKFTSQIGYRVRKLISKIDLNLLRKGGN